MKQKYDVTGMTCAACSSRVEKCVSKLRGIDSVSVNLLTNSMQVEYKDGALTENDIISCVEKAGYGASVQSPASNPRQKKTARPKKNVAKEQAKRMKKRLIASFIFWIPLFYVCMGHMLGAPLPRFLTGHHNAVTFALLQLCLVLPIMYINRNFFEKGFTALFHGAPNMDSLVAMGSATAFIYSLAVTFVLSYALGSGNTELLAAYHMNLQYESAGTILTLITVGKYLEAKSKGKTSEALEKLMDLAPKTAVVIREDGEEIIPVEDVVVGDIVAVKPGMSIPVDGTVIEGSTSVDRSAITGESIPVEKNAGDSVIGATINKTGFVKIRATKVGEDTAFAQIIRLVEDASATKAPIAKMADKIAGVFVPAVIGIAVLTFAVWAAVIKVPFVLALERAITILVISCPCALGLATPLAIMVGTGKGAENGILIKSGEALEQAHNINTVVLDKTGTITQGKPVVTDIITSMDADEFISLARAMESRSEHPLASAVTEYAKGKGISYAEPDSFTAVPGKGIKAEIGGDGYLAGNGKFIAENGIDTAPVAEYIDRLADEGKTPLIFSKNGAVIGIVAAADTVKPTSKRAIDKMRSMGIEVIMLTGDNERTANGIAKGLNLSKVIADVLPRDKEKVVSSLQGEGKTVAMVGDGINDAPALVRADVGIAIGAGTDVAVESADVVLMKSDLLDVPNAISLSKAVIKNIKQNLFWAFFYNCLGIPLAAGVLLPFGIELTPSFGAFAMSFSSLFVCTNALRLRFFKVEKNTAETNSGSAAGEVSFTKIDEIPRSKIPVDKKAENEYNTIMDIDGMMCDHCVRAVTNAIKSVDGVTNVVVSLADNRAVFTADESRIDSIVRAIKDEDYEVTKVTRV